MEEWWTLGVRTMESSERLEIRILNNSSVPDLKLKLLDKTGVDVDRQRLIFRGQVLQNDQTLASYSITDGVTLHMVERKLEDINRVSATNESQNETTPPTGTSETSTPFGNTGAHHLVLVGTRMSPDILSALMGNNGGRNAADWQGSVSNINEAIDELSSTHSADSLTFDRSSIRPSQLAEIKENMDAFRRYLDGDMDFSRGYDLLLQVMRDAVSLLRCANSREDAGNSNSVPHFVEINIENGDSPVRTFRGLMPRVGTGVSPLRSRSRTSSTFPRFSSSSSSSSSPLSAVPGFFQRIFESVLRSSEHEPTRRSDRSSGGRSSAREEGRQSRRRKRSRGDDAGDPTSPRYRRRRDEE